MEGGNSGGERARAENNGYTGENTNMTTTTKDVEMDVDEEKPQREKETSNTAVGGDVVGNGVSSGESGASGEGPKVSRNPAADCDSGAKGEDEEKSEQEKRLWSTVTTNPSDFTSWTSLLQLTEQKSVLSSVQEAFPRFLQLYPFCYGYWKKYSDLVRKLSGDEAARGVMEGGVAAVPLSVALWLHYANFAVSYYSGSPQAEELIRSVYDRAIQSCGLEYRSVKIWESYIAWESGGGRQRQVTALYDMLLATPTKDLPTHFENFKKLLETTPTSQMLSEEEYKEVVIQAGDVNQGEAMLDSYARKVTLERRTAMFEKSMIEFEKRKHFEAMIKRPYFHVKPLERNQLKNWRDYLDFEIAQGDRERVVFLFERCMIACALYEDFWSKYCKYCEDHIPEQASSIYRRACTIHQRQKPHIHLSWAAFEEKSGSVETARDILAGIDSAVPGMVSVRLRRIGLEVRSGYHSQAEALYQECLSGTISLDMRNFYAWRYARFADKILQDHSRAVSIMTSAIDTDPSNTQLYLQLLDLHTSGHAPPDLAGADALFRRVALSDHVKDEAKESFLLRRQQLLEEFGGSLSELLEVTEKVKKVRKRFASETQSESDPAKKQRVEPLMMATPTSTPQMGVAQPLTPEQQQWAAYQQQWGGYNYAQPQQQGYSYPGYYPYAQQPTT